MKTLEDARKILDRAAESIERLLKPQEHGLTIVGTYSPERLTVELFLSAGADKMGWLGEITLEQAEQGLWPGQAQAIRDRYDNLVEFYEKSNKLNFDVHICAHTNGNPVDKSMDDMFRKTDFSFGIALSHLKNGRKIARAGWHDKSMFIGKYGRYHELIGVHREGQDYCLWNANSFDLLQNDWYIYGQVI